MRLEDLYIGAALAVMVMSGALFILTQQSINYNVTFDNSSFSRVTQQSVDLYQSSSDMKDQISGGQVSETSAFDNMLSGVYLALRSLMSTFGLIGTMGTALFREFAFVHPIIMTTMFGIVTFLFVMAIIYLVFRVYK